MLAGTFTLVMAQRLLRKLNSTTKLHVSVKDTQFYQWASKNLEAFSPDVLKEEVAARGITPEQWNAFVKDGMAYVPVDENGYAGRVGLFEMMDYTADIKNLLLNGKSAFEVEDYALQHGMINLERDGIFKVIQ